MVCCHIEDQDQKTIDDDSESNDESKCSDFSIDGFRYSLISIRQNYNFDMSAMI